MKIKKYLVKDIKEALIQIKQELGENAVILQTRRIRKGGFLGIFGGEIFTEVTAVAEENTSSVDSKKKDFDNQEDTIYNLREILSRNIRKNLNNVKNYEKGNFNGVKPENHDEIDNRNVSNGNPIASTNIIKDIEEIKRMFVQLNAKIEMFNGDLSEFPAELKKLFNRMVDQSISKDLSLKMLYELKDEESFEINRLSDLISRYFEKLIKVEVPDIGNGISMFLGPTGVGKTTTLAKLAANLKLKQKKKVAILTIDTYRIAAVSQLKTYSEIMNIPFFVAYTPQEARNIISTIENFDSILIDTAGRSQRDEIHLDELKKYVEVVKSDYRFLLLNIAINTKDLIDTIERFSLCEPTHLIFTKLDETNNFGNILNVGDNFNLPIAFITTGQDVPDDIEIADSKRLSELITKEVFKNV
ncbi:MAG TPA: flagellar biosynthesis protein FlhF [Thermotogaceae bacterium]|nr:flagellar biosynthesis protein FlhF [Thermotogaceae bacterium]